MSTKSNTHPAFGMVGFRRVSGNPGPLFGASVDCMDFIELEIKSGEDVEFRDGHHSYMAGNKSYIRVALSPAQFSTLLTTMNISDGVPCTIRRLNGQEVERIPEDFQQNELDRQKENFNQYMSDFKDYVVKSRIEINEILSKKTIGKADREQINRILHQILVRTDDNIPFYMEEFQDATDKIVQEAKAVIDETVQHAVVSTGLKVLGEQFQKGMVIEDKTK